MGFLLLEETLLLVLSFGAMTIVFTVWLTGRSMCYALLTGNCELVSYLVYLPRSRFQAVLATVPSPSPLGFTRARVYRVVSRSVPGRAPIRSVPK
jgi:hypothetical protein